MNATKAIKFNELGGPEVLRLVDVEIPVPKKNEATIRHHAIGVNFIDTYYRTGLYKTDLPSGLGVEGAGVVLDIGENVTHIKKGDRVAYALGPLGAYAKERTMPAWHLVKIPESLSFEDAASVMLKGLTVQFLFRQTYRLKAGETILFHAAAGGVGLLACQWARHIGVKLIGTVSTEGKAQIAMENGAFKTINYTKENLVEKVMEYTQGEKVAVVYDSIGRDTWTSSLDCLRTRGLMVSFGNTSGAVTGVNLGDLATKGSLYVTRPTLGSYIRNAEELNLACNELIDLIASKKITVNKGKSYALADAGQAHEYLKAHERSGGIILIP